MPCSGVAWFARLRQNPVMSSPTPASNSDATPWGPSISCGIHDLWLVVVHLYSGHPVWRQVPLTLDETSPIPRAFTAEIEEVTRAVMLALGKELEQQSHRKAIEHILASRSMAKMVQEGVISQEAIENDWVPMHLEGELLEALALRMSPHVRQSVLDGIRSSLSIVQETLPFSLLPPGERGERQVAMQDAALQPAIGADAVSRNRLVAKTVLSRTIWPPSLMPFIVRRDWIPDLLAQRTHLAFQEVDLQSPKGDPKTVVLTPRDWTRYDLVDPTAAPLVSLPLSTVGCPPTAEGLTMASAQYADRPQARDALSALAKGHPGGRWFTLVDLGDD